MVQKDRIDCFGRTTHKMLTNRCGFFGSLFSYGFGFFGLVLHATRCILTDFRKICVS